MTFMLSSLRVSDTMHNDENAHARSGSNKRKSISLLPSSPAKQLKRFGRFSLLSASSSSSASSSGRDLDGLATRKSPPTCTISLENVTVINSFDLRTSTNAKAMDMPPSIPVKPKPQPLDIVDVNVIPFPSEPSVSEPDSPTLGYPPGLPGPSANGRRRRSNHLLLKPQPQPASSTVKKHRRSHASTISISKRAPLSPISLADAGAPRSSDRASRKASPPPMCRRGDVRFTALVRRSVLVGLAAREHHQSQMEFVGMDMDVDMDVVGSFGHGRSESVTLDILNDEADATLAHQDHLLVDRLGKFLAECGYREPLSPSNHHIILPPLSIEPRRPASPVLSMVSTSTSSPSSSDPDPFAFDPIGNRPSSPIPPLESEPVSSSPSSSDPIPIPSARRSSPPLSSHRSTSPRSTDPASKVLTPPQLVATLVLRHRDRLAIRPRRSFEDIENQHLSQAQSGSASGRRRSPLACEAVTLSRQACEELEMEMGDENEVV
ncbi:hypothetical protein VKT23_018988 [Stygiomarasmius scandens]|uniref:Uncharacterized protein n=1 Tax=Marasmiellus scandens TaxID=2682957 RepID=A0ABR1IRZ1_9AGAR